MNGGSLQDRRLEEDVLPLVFMGSHADTSYSRKGLHYGRDKQPINVRISKSQRLWHDLIRKHVQERNQ